MLISVQLTSDPAVAMALKPGDGGLDPSSRALLDKLDERLVGCIPKKVENAHGVDYTVGLDELKKVSVMHLSMYCPRYHPTGRGGGFDLYEINCLSPGANARIKCPP